MPVEDLVRHSAVGGAVDEGQGVGAVPGDADDGDRGVREDAADSGVGKQILELQEWLDLTGSECGQSAEG